MNPKAIENKLLEESQKRHKLGTLSKVATISALVSQLAACGVKQAFVLDSNRDLIQYRLIEQKVYREGDKQFYEIYQLEIQKFNKYEPIEGKP